MFAITMACARLNMKTEIIEPVWAYGRAMPGSAPQAHAACPPDEVARNIDVADDSTLDPQSRLERRRREEQELLVEWAMC